MLWAENMMRSSAHIRDWYVHTLSHTGKHPMARLETQPQGGFALLFVCSLPFELVTHTWASKYLRKQKNEVIFALERLHCDSEVGETFCCKTFLRVFYNVIVILLDCSCLKPHEDICHVLNVFQKALWKNLKPQHGQTEKGMVGGQNGCMVNAEEWSVFYLFGKRTGGLPF